METDFVVRSAVVRLSLREQVRQNVLQRILRGDYSAGERLTESRLAAEFGVSVAPVREALRELEALGFVVSSPHRGVCVRAVSPEELNEVYPVRAALEGTAARLAAGRLGDHAARLTAAIEGMEKAADTNSVEGYVQHSVVFHRSLVEAADNRLLVSVWNSLAIEARTLISVTTRVADLAEAARSHRPIVDALRAGDGDLAGRLASEHVEHAGRCPALICG